MWTLESAAALATIFLAITAIATLAYQMREAAKARRDEAAAVLRAGKMQIITDLVAYRFILTGNDGGEAENSSAILQFDTALSKIPIQFINNPEVLRQYRQLGDNFTAQKFWALVKEMLVDATGPVPKEFDVSVLESVPRRRSRSDRDSQR